MNRDYILNIHQDVSYHGTTILSAKDVEKAMNLANTALKDLNDSTILFDINIF